MIENKENMMTTKEAWAIVGNEPKWALKNMIRALSMMSLLNTEEENLRLHAARLALKTPNPRYN